MLGCTSDTAIALVLQAAERSSAAPRLRRRAAPCHGDYALARDLQEAEFAARGWAADRGARGEAPAVSPLLHGRVDRRRAGRERPTPPAAAETQVGDHGPRRRGERLALTVVTGRIVVHEGAGMKVQARVWRPHAVASSSVRETVKGAFANCVRHMQDLGYDWTLELEHIAGLVVGTCARRGLGVEALSIELRGARRANRERDFVFQSGRFSEFRGASLVSVPRSLAGRAGGELARRQRGASGSVSSAGSDASASDSERATEEPAFDVAVSVGQALGLQSLRHEGGDQGPCVVCLCDFRHGERLRYLPCMHRFHAECIDRWLRGDTPGASACPICKCDVRP